MATDRIEEAFDQLAEELLAAAAKVDCSAADYRAGLRGVIDSVKTAIAASEETDANGD